MARYVPDSKTKRWVIISPARMERPHVTIPQLAGGAHVCPFCAGNESLTPPEVYRIGTGEPNTAGWQVRVIPNKYPITDIHEVIVHSPKHDMTIQAMNKDDLKSLWVAYRDRYRAYEHDGQVMIFSNFGEHAGASISHPHSQLVVVPGQINFDALSREPIHTIVKEEGGYVLYCPDFSQWPYELWLAPRGSEATTFGDTKEQDLATLASLLKESIQAMQAVYSDPDATVLHRGLSFAYNYYISHGPEWFLRIIPRFIHRAGFELGTGLSVNSIDPVLAAEKFRKYFGE